MLVVGRGDGLVVDIGADIGDDDVNDDIGDDPGGDPADDSVDDNERWTDRCGFDPIVVRVIVVNVAWQRRIVGR